MELANAYTVKVFAAPELDGFCAVALRGSAAVGVAWETTRLAALRVARRRARVRRLAETYVRGLMMALSERNYAATWHLGLEARLYRRAFVAGGVPEPELAELRRRAETVGVWWIWPEEVEDGPVCISLAEAHRQFGGDVARAEGTP